MILPFSSLESFLNQTHHENCFVDTSTLIAATYPLDPFNEQSEPLFDLLLKFKMPAYTNVNIRAEFLEIHRRILIPECLIDFLDDFQGQIGGVLEEKLKTHKKVYRQKLQENKPGRFDTNQIKSYRQFFSSFDLNNKSG